MPRHKEGLRDRKRAGQWEIVSLSPLYSRYSSPITQSPFAVFPAFYLILVKYNCSFVLVNQAVTQKQTEDSSHTVGYSPLSVKENQHPHAIRQKRLNIYLRKSHSFTHSAPFLVTWEQVRVTLVQGQAQAWLEEKKLRLGSGIMRVTGLQSSSALAVLILSFLGPARWVQRLLPEQTDLTAQGREGSCDIHHSSLPVSQRPKNNESLRRPRRG